MTLPIVVYTSETARLIMALKRNETKRSSFKNRRMRVINRKNSVFDGKLSLKSSNLQSKNCLSGANSLTTFLQITMYTTYKSDCVILFYSKSLKKSRKNYGNRFTNKNLTPKIICSIVKMLPGKNKISIFCFEIL